MRKLLVISLTLSVCIFVGCSNNDKNGSGSEGDQERRESESRISDKYDGMTITPVSDVIGFSIRDPQNDAERFAMQFVDSLFFRDYDTIVSMTEIESLAPSAPLGVRSEDLYNVIIQHCVGFMNFQVTRNYSDFNFSRDMYTGLHKTWADRGVPEARSIGIVDVSDVGIVVAHSWDGTHDGFYAAGKQSGTNAEVHGAATIRVMVDTGSDGSLKAIAAPYLQGIHGELVPMSFTFTAPSGGVASFRGEILEPVGEVSGFNMTYDKFEIKDMHYRVSEEISIDYGEVFGIIRDNLVVDNLGSDMNDGTLRLFNNSNSNSLLHSNPLYSHFPLMATTMPEYQPIADETMSALVRTVKLVIDSLETNNFDAIIDLMIGNSEAWRNRQNTEREFNRWIDGENETVFTGVKRELYIDSISVLAPRSYQAKFYNTLVAPSGKTFFSSSDIILSKIDGEWQIYQLSHELFIRTATCWFEIDEEIEGELSAMIKIEL